MITIHHASLSETNTKKLLQYDKLNVLQDDSWNLKIFLSKISEKRNSLFSDFAKNSLIREKVKIIALLDIVEEIKAKVPIFGKELFEEESHQWKVNK